MLKALPGFALIELPQKYESGLKTEKEKYAARSEGVLVDVNVKSITYEGKPTGIYHNNVGNTVYFAAYEDGEVVKHDDKEYVFVAVKSLRGVKQDAEA